jgi:hypothetical protein
MSYLRQQNLPKHLRQSVREKMYKGRCPNLIARYYLAPMRKERLKLFFPESD